MILSLLVPDGSRYTRAAALRNCCDLTKVEIVEDLLVRWVVLIDSTRSRTT